MVLNSKYIVYENYNVKIICSYNFVRLNEIS